MNDPEKTDSTQSADSKSSNNFPRTETDRVSILRRLRDRLKSGFRRESKQHKTQKVDPVGGMTRRDFLKAALAAGAAGYIVSKVGKIGYEKLTQEPSPREKLIKSFDELSNELVGYQGTVVEEYTMPPTYLRVKFKVEDSTYLLDTFRTAILTERTLVVTNPDQNENLVYTIFDDRVYVNDYTTDKYHDLSDSEMNQLRSGVKSAFDRWKEDTKPEKKPEAQPTRDLLESI